MRRSTHGLSVAAVLALALVACASNKDTGLPAGPTTPSAGSACSGTVDMIDQLKFVPEKCTVKLQTTVVWKNTGSAPHTVTEVDPKVFDSGITTLVNGGAEFKFTFTKVGTYPYYCRLHSPDKVTGMVGQIVVEAA